MTPYGPMRRMQKHKPGGKAPTPAPVEEKAMEAPAGPVKKKPKPEGIGYYRYVLERHEAVTSKFSDEEEDSTDKDT